MVVFTCNHCGETLHKPKVEKHYQFSCLKFKSVTCVDCLKDFQNEEYVAHTKCLTENERYAAKGTYKNGNIKKGEVKQESWLDMIKSICDSEVNLKASQRDLLNTISGFSNVPRKKPKFMNFIKNSSGGRVQMKDIEEVWNIIEKYKSMKSGNSQNQFNKVICDQQEENTNGKNGTEEFVAKKSSNKKRSIESVATSPSKKVKLESFNQTTCTVDKKVLNTLDNTSESMKFDFKKNILEILSVKRSISHKKLQKKVLKAYLNESGQAECSEKIIKKFNKKLNKLDIVSIEGDKVILLDK